VETGPIISLWNQNKVWAYMDQFKDDLRTLMEKLRSHAVTGDSLRKFAAGNTTAPNSQTIYGLVQCTPDLSQQDCDSCLVAAIKGIPDYCNGKEGGRVVKPSCDVRFEVSPFYNLTADTSSPISPVALPVSPPPPLTNVNATKGTHISLF
jgi:hypothetical protein